jgi:ABC-2 type transport system ATP-binding protein
MVTVDQATGVKLDASLYVPNTKPPKSGFPLIVRQHGGGSNKDNPYDTLYAKKAVGTGHYAALMYSVRGHGNSSGVFDFFGPQSTEDFSRMLDWVAATAAPGTVDTENVGVSGYSQGGGMSLLPAESDPRVKAVAVGNTFDSLNHALNPNGCYKFSWATGIFLAAYKASMSRTDDVTAVRWGLTLYTDTEDVGAPVALSTSEQMAEHSPLTYVGKLVDRRVPVFWSNSWEDQLFPSDHPDSILGVLKANGVSTHYWFASGGHAAGPDDPTDQAGKEAAMLEWFDAHLRGVHTNAFDHRVDYAERVPETAASWIHKTASDWPIPGATATVLYPHLDGTLGAAEDSSAPFVGAMVNDLANVNVRNDAIVKEIANNVPPGMGSTIGSLPEIGTPADTRAYVSAPLSADLEVVGAPVVDLAITSTSVHQFQVSAKVIDLAPDDLAVDVAAIAPGASGMMVNRGCISLPGQTGSAALPLWPNAHVFKAGHRIALVTSAVDFPVFEPDKEPQVTLIGAGTTLSLPTISP